MAIETHTKNFDQWRKARLLPFSLLLDIKVWNFIAKSLFEKPITNTFVHYSFLEKDLHVPSFINYLFEKCDQK